MISLNQATQTRSS